MCDNQMDFQSKILRMHRDPYDPRPSPTSLLSQGQIANDKDGGQPNRPSQYEKHESPSSPPYSKRYLLPS